MEYPTPVFTFFVAIIYILCVDFSAPVLALPAPFNNTLPNSHQNNSNSSSISAPQNATSPIKRQGWTSSPNGRGTIDILWNCAFTMFLCSWSILCMNVPSPKDGIRHIFHRRTWLTILCFACPEGLVLTAAGQWISARNSVRDFRDAKVVISAEKDKQWKMQNAFFADMGGYMLHTPGYKPFPVDAKQLLFLIKNGFVELPALDSKGIEDRNKVDGLLRIITVCQVVYFVVDIIGRAVTGLTITCLELTAGAFIVCSGTTIGFWIYKPADVQTSEQIHSRTPLLEIVLAAMEEMKKSPEATKDLYFTAIKDTYNIIDPGARKNRVEEIVSEILDKKLYYQTPLYFISRKEWQCSIYWTHCMHILRRAKINFAPEELPVDRWENTNFLFLPRGMYWGFMVISAIYAGIFFFSWNYVFPTYMERYLWRAACITVISDVFAFAAVNDLAFELYPKLRDRVAENSNKSNTGGARGSNGTPSKWKNSWLYKKLHRVAEGLRNNSRPKDPQLAAPLKSIVALYIGCFLYCAARSYIFLSDLLELRSLPANAYDTVDWSSVFPHLN